MAESDYRTVPNGGVLATLNNGLVIVRRWKHEWTPMVETLAGEVFTRYTDRKSGSKFNRQWTLSRYVDWLQDQVEALDWTDQSSPQDHTVEMNQPVGYSKGEPVTKIRIELSSRSVHAYPVKE
ncbi:MAG: hypothetical protein H0T11_06465 [Chthoniobacterales bacterium]|nr:hypothetical protein [Chthoniobacterales bacterium]